MFEREEAVMAEVCETGLWADKRTGRVVESEPEEGHLLVAPGATVTPTIAAQIERARAVAPADPEPEVLEKPAEDEDEKPGKATEPAVETAAAPSAPETATAASAGRPAGKGRK